jgi:hypothetical protein
MHYCFPATDLKMFLELKKKWKATARSQLKEKNQQGNAAGAGTEEGAGAETEKGGEAETEGGVAVGTDAAAVAAAETEGGEGVVAKKDAEITEGVAVPAEIVAGIEAGVNLGKKSSFLMSLFRARYLHTIFMKVRMIPMPTL